MLEIMDGDLLIFLLHTYLTFLSVLAEDCRDFILETLPLSRIFDCRRYPDWDENQQCINFSKGKPTRTYIHVRICSSNHHAQ